MTEVSQIINVEFQVKYGSPLIGMTLKELKNKNPKYLVSFRHYHKTTKPEEMPTEENRRGVNDGLKIKANEWYHACVDDVNYDGSYKNILKSCITRAQLEAKVQRRKEEKLAEILSRGYKQ